jgi:hypothetical protein
VRIIVSKARHSSVSFLATLAKLDAGHHHEAIYAHARVEAEFFLHDFRRISEDTFMIKSLLSIAAVAFLVCACGDDASKKAPSGATTPPPAEKKEEPKK